MTFPRSVRCGAALGAFLASHLCAQNEIKLPHPPAVGTDTKSVPPSDRALPSTPTKTTVMAATATRPAAERFTAVDDPDAIVFDRLANDDVWAAAHDYKVHATTAGWTFVARPLTGHREHPVTFGLQSIRCAEGALEMQDGAIAVSEHVISLARGCTTELLDVRADGVEHSFRFDTLPNRGELALDLAVATTLQAETLGHGVVLRSEDAGVQISEAVAIDADGASLHVPTVWHDGHLAIRVPAAFVAAAKLPLVIDPLVSTTIVNTQAYELGQPDLAWDETNQEWMACWHRVFSPTDTDVFAVRLTPQMQPIGNPTAIDISADTWERPRIANNGIADNFLVVAQVSTDTASPYWIAGRIIDATAIAAAPVVIEQAGLPQNLSGDKLAPDVCGDPNPNPPTYYTVVWERAYSTTDHDIHMKQLTSAGTLRSASPTLIENSTAYTIHPAISKSNGPAPSSAQRCAVVYEDAPRLGGSSVRAAMLTWDGQIVPVGGAPTFLIAQGGFLQSIVDPVVSSPTGGPAPRQFLVAGANGGEIDLSMIDSSGTVLANTMLHTLTGVATMPTQEAPSVDCDGARFALSYVEYAGVANPDVHTCLIAPMTNGMRLDEGPITVASATDPDTFPAVASRYSGSGTPSSFYGLLEQRWSAANSKILGWNYDGVAAGGVSVRSAGCGNLATVVTGRPLPGTTVSMTLTNANGLGGFVAGSALPTLIFPACPECTIGVAGNTLFSSQIDIVVPWSAAFTGTAITVQGFSLQGGTCYGSVRIGDAIDLVVQ